LEIGVKFEDEDNPKNTVLFALVLSQQRELPRLIVPCTEWFPFVCAAEIGVRYVSFSSNYVFKIISSFPEELLSVTASAVLGDWPAQLSRLGRADTCTRMLSLRPALVQQKKKTRLFRNYFVERTEHTNYSGQSVHMATSAGKICLRRKTTQTNQNTDYFIFFLKIRVVSMECEEDLDLR